MNGNLPCLWNFNFLGWDGVVTELWEFMGWDGWCCDGIVMVMWLRFVMLLLWLWEGSLLLLEKERVEMEIRLQEVRDHKVVKWWLALCVVAWFLRAELASWLGEVKVILWKQHRSVLWPIEWVVTGLWHGRFCNNLNDLCELREGSGVLMTLSYDCEICKLIIWRWGTVTSASSSLSELSISVTATLIFFLSLLLLFLIAASRL